MSPVDCITSSLAVDFSFSIVSLNFDVPTVADNIPVTMAGIPADRRVVDDCSAMHLNAPLVSSVNA